MKMYHLLRRLVQGFLRVTFTVTVEGLENIPKEGGLLLCSNHMSNFDPLTVGSFAPRLLHYMAKEELFRVPILGSVIRACGAFPIRRGAADSVALRKAIRLLEQGGVLLMFPQGTRKSEVLLKDFKRGAAMLAYRSRVPILPVGIVGRYTLFGRLTVRYGRLIQPEEYLSRGEAAEVSREELDKISELLFERIKELTQP